MLRNVLPWSMVAVAVVVFAASCSNSAPPNGNGAGGQPASGAASGGAGSGGRAPLGGSGGSVGSDGGDAGQAGQADRAGSSGTGGDDSGGSSGDSGSGGSEAGAAGSAPLNCDDGNANSADFLSATYGCGHLIDSDPNDGASWILFDAGFSVDPKTKIAWYINGADEGGGNLIGNQASCAALSLSVLSDWRVPTIDEARTLDFGCPKTMAGGSCPLHDPTCLSETCAFGVTSECESCPGGPGHNYMNPDSNFKDRSLFHTSSLCTDCPGPQKDWTYLWGNGNFYAYNVSSASAIVCVIPNVEGALPL